jgi:biotin carboxylase
MWTGDRDSGRRTPRLMLLLGSAPHRQMALRTLLREGGHLTVLDAEDSDFVRLVDDIVLLEDPRDVHLVGAAVRAAIQSRPDAVITFNDAYLESVGDAIAALGLRGISAEAARSAYHKDRMREALRRHGVPVPDFRVVDDPQDAERAAADLGYPVCVKPSNRSAGLGVRAVANPADLRDAVDCAWRCRLGGTGVVLVERLARGVEASVEALVVGDDPVVYAVVDKHVSNGARRIETGHVVPGSPPGGAEQLTATADAAVRALGIRDWPTHSEIMLTDHGPTVIEVNARVAGGLIPDLVHSASGFDVYRAMADLLLGRPVDVGVQWRQAAAIAFLFTEPGRLSEVDGVSAARRCRGIEEVTMDVRAGDLLPELSSNMHRRGFVRAVGDDPESARAACVRAAARIRLRIDDAWQPAVTGFDRTIEL